MVGELREATYPTSVPGSSCLGIGVLVLWGLGEMVRGRQGAARSSPTLLGRVWPGRFLALWSPVLIQPAGGPFLPPHHWYSQPLQTTLFFQWDLL